MRRRELSVARVARWLALALCVVASDAHAQRLSVPRPSDERPALPETAPAERPDVLEAPPEHVVPAPRAPAEAAGPRVLLRAVRVSGSSVLDEDDVARLASPWLGREVTGDELVALTDTITREYVRRGLVTSGAWLPDQRLEDGTVEICVIEGVLGDVEVAGLRWLRPFYVRDRVRLGAGPPLDVRELDRALQVLLQDPRLRSVHAELVPGATRGEARLRVRAEEAFPVHLALQTANDEPPDVGSWRTAAQLWSDDVTGLGDVLRVGWAWSRGLDTLDASWAIPWNAWDGTIGARLAFDQSDVVEAPLEALDVESATRTLAVELRQPVLRDPRASVVLTLAGELRESRSYLLGHRFSYVPGVEDGLARVSVLRAGTEATWRDRVQVLALRSMFSFGLDAFDASDVGGRTIEGGEIPGASFVSWLVQLQAARRLPWAGIELLGRVDCQLATKPLLPIEQIAFGGATTVRGYRENTLVRDGGLLGSIEARVPLWSRADGSPFVAIVPFVDAASGWNTGRRTPAPDWIGGAGIGLRLTPFRGVVAEAAWAARLNRVDRPDTHDLQDAGVHLRLAIEAF